MENRDQASDQSKSEISKPIILIHYQTPIADEKFLSEMRKGGFEIQFAKNLDETAQVLKAKSPICVFLDVPGSLGGASSRVEEIYNLENSPPVFLLARQLDTFIEDSFYLGVEGIFFEPISAKNVLLGIKFSLNSTGSDGTARKFRRHKVRRSAVDYSSASQGLQSSGPLVNLSKGGMYVCAQADFPEPKHLIDFRLSIDALGKSLVGQGYVRWVRSKFDNGRPPGFGVEFVNLSEDDKTFLALVLRE